LWVVMIVSPSRISNFAVNGKEITNGSKS
jgi:hypothetical protein